MGKAAIPDKFHKTVLELAGQGKSTRAISAHLGTLGVTASHVAVGRLLQTFRTERAEVAKVVVREELATTLTADIRRLERLVKRTLARIRRTTADDAYCRLVEQVRKLIETKLKHSGADEPDHAVTCGPTVLIPPEAED